MDREPLWNPKALIAASLIGSWLVFLSPFWPLVVLIVLAGGIYLASRSRKGSITLILLSPLVVVPSFSLMAGSWGYVAGNGRIMTYGLPGGEFYNLDPTYRCYRSSSGCIVNGSEFLSQSPNNIAIQVLTTLFGPMRGAYVGPYPAREEAIRSAAESKLRFLPGEFPRHAVGLGLPPARIEAIQRDLEQLEKDIPITASIFQEETVVLGRERLLFLVERRTGKTYARYFFRSTAWMLLANGEVDRAIAELDHAIEVDPRNPDYRQKRGEAYLKKGDTGRAAEDFRTALTLAPDSWYGRTEVQNALSRIPSSGTK